MITSMMRRALLSGDGSTLNLDFTTMSTAADLTSRGVTFTRGSGSNISGTGPSFIGSNGYVQYAGTNVPRFDYDPSTQTPKGLLLEGTSTNVVFHSNGSTSIWTIGGQRTPTNNTTDLLSPDGTNNATKLVLGTAGQYASYAQDVSGLTAGAQYTVSFWIRGPVGYNPRLYAVNGVVGDITATAQTNTYNNTGWSRVTQTYTLPAGTTRVYVYFMSANIVNTGDTFYVWGFQMELGSAPSSLIPTAASTATRVADTAIIAAGSAFTSWYTGNTNGTFYADWHGGVRSTTGTNRTVLSTSDVVNRHFHMLQTAAAGNLRVSDFGASTSVTTANAMTSGARTKGAFSFNGGNVKLCLNGGTVASGSVVFSTAPTYLVIGGTSTNGTSITDANVLLNGCVRQIKYWPTILPDAQLQSLTA